MMLCLFGYMDLMIVIKWCSNYFGIESQAPSIITTMVGLFLDGGKVQGLYLFPGQRVFSILMVLIVCLCVPWMLLVKPFYLYKENERLVKERKTRGDIEMSQIDNPY